MADGCLATDFTETTGSIAFCSVPSVSYSFGIFFIFLSLNEILTKASFLSTSDPLFTFAFSERVSLHRLYASPFGQDRNE